jgi:glycosyltransferase involved in cell wall biosynthesis
MIERGIGILDCVVLSRFDAVVVVSDAVGRRLRSSTLPGKIVTIDNGIKCAAFGMCEERTPQSRRASGSIVVGTVARLSREKGVRYLLDAAADVLAERPDTRFVIAGDGPDRGALLAQSERLGIDHRVSFLGAQSDMAHFYAGIDLFVLPSLTEGMPMALIEAMAAGKPVVATTVGSVPVIVEHLNDGVLVAPGDTAALAEALKLLLRRSDLRATMGRRAQATAEARFSAESMALQYRRLYEAVNVAKMRPRAWANVGRA